MSHFSSSNGYSKRRTSQAGGIFMKRWRYLCAAALIAGSMTAEAGTVSIPSTALTQLQQQWQADTSADYLSSGSGQSHIAAYALVPKKSVQNFCRQLVRYCRFENWKIIVPAEYTTIDVLTADFC